MRLPKLRHLVSLVAIIFLIDLLLLLRIFDTTVEVTSSPLSAEGLLLWLPPKTLAVVADGPTSPVKIALSQWKTQHDCHSDSGPGCVTATVMEEGEDAALVVVRLSDEFKAQLFRISFQSSCPPHSPQIQLEITQSDRESLFLPLLLTLGNSRPELEDRHSSRHLRRSRCGVVTPTLKLGIRVLWD